MKTKAELPHVTQILREIGLVDATWFTDHMRERGTALHRACELHDKGDLDNDSIDPEIEDSLKKYRRFIDDFPSMEILAIEKEVIYPGLYQGRLDRQVRINGTEGILDIKGQASKVDPLQLAGYALTFRRSMARWNLYLRAGSNYKLVRQDKNIADRVRDDAVWMSCVRIANWRRANGYK
jgi:hypothetical protein